MENDGKFMIYDSNINLTISSQNTISEMKIGKNQFFKLFYIFTTFFNSILGLYLIKRFHSLFIDTNNVDILVYITIYTFKWPLAFIIGTLLAIILILLKRLCSSEYTEENSPNYLSHIFVCSLYILVLAYISSVPWSIYLLVKMVEKDSIQYKVNFHEKYEFIYIFLTINFIHSFIIFSIFLYFLLITNIPFKKNTQRDDIDEEFIKKIREEINESNKISGVIPANNELILQNKFFSKHSNAKSVEVMNKSQIDVPKSEFLSQNQSSGAKINEGNSDKYSLDNDHKTNQKEELNFNM